MSDHNLAMSVWNPYLKHDVNELEKVQKRVTKISKGNLFNSTTIYFYYNGNEQLPYKMTDSIPGANDAYVYSHLYTYDNFSRVIFDTITEYDSTSCEWFCRFND